MSKIYIIVWIVIGFFLGYIIGVEINEDIWKERLRDCWGTTDICIENLRECQKDTSPDECEILIDDYIDILEESRNKCSILLDEVRDSCDGYLDSCYERNNDWKEMFDDLIDDCYGYDYNYDYETEDFMIINGVEYDCTYNRYDCKDFPEWADAQTLFIYCKTEGKGDIHYLDGDNDGTACEELKWDYGESNLNFGLLK